MLVAVICCCCGYVGVWFCAGGCGSVFCSVVVVLLFCGCVVLWMWLVWFCSVVLFCGCCGFVILWLWLVWFCSVFVVGVVLVLVVLTCALSVCCCPYDAPGSHNPPSDSAWPCLRHSLSHCANTSVVSTLTPGGGMHCL